MEGWKMEDTGWCWSEIKRRWRRLTLSMLRAESGCSSDLTVLGHGMSEKVISVEGCLLAGSRAVWLPTEHRGKGEVRE